MDQDGWEPLPPGLINHDVPYVPHALSAVAQMRLQADLKELTSGPIEGVAIETLDNDVSAWLVYMEGPKESAFEGGVFQLRVEFPEDYPDNPPVVRFLSEFFHPNVYPDGKVCMSTLHSPGDNEYDNETGDIRWRPIYGVSSILSSILLILQEPNLGSPANIDANIMWKKDWEGYKKRIHGLCTLSAQEFKRNHSDVYIPHPDTNPADRATPAGDEDDGFDEDWDLEAMDEGDDDADSGSLLSSGSGSEISSDGDDDEDSD